MTTDAARADVWTGLTDVFHAVFGDDTIVLTPETTARDVEGWDSITHVQLVVAIEERFGVHFNTGETAGLKNVGQMVELITARR
jgi:acyl carrier protein